MRASDILIGEYYRHKDHPNYSWAKALEILKPREKENTNNFIVVKCEYVVDKWWKYGSTRYFKPVNLLKDNK